MSTETKTENVTLFFQQGGSDKIYKAFLENAEEADKYLVNFAYGRRGATLKTGTKTQAPVEYDAAKKIFDKLVHSKTSKGYVPHEDDAKYVTVNEQVSTGIHCQLLNPIEQTELEELIADKEWWAQEKKDGRRMLIQKTEELTAINRRGFSIGAPQAIMDSATAIDKQFLIDGEAIGEVFYAFDLLSLDGEDIQEKSYKERLALLEGLKFSGAIEVVATAKTKAKKQKLHDDLKAASSEGVVFKKHSATYTPGRPNSGGNQRKFKFYDTASVIVSKVNDKRSVAMMVYDGDKEVAVGNVTISVNKEIPPAGSIIEVRYLYAYKGGSLYQPTFLHIRTDLEQKECAITQLKYKQEA